MPPEGQNSRAVDTVPAQRPENHTSTGPRQHLNKLPNKGVIVDRIVRTATSAGKPLRLGHSLPANSTPAASDDPPRALEAEPSSRLYLHDMSAISDKRLGSHSGAGRVRFQ